MSLDDSVIKHLHALREAGTEPARATLASIAEGFKVERRDIPRLLAMAVSKGQLRRGQDANLQFFFELGAEAVSTSVHAQIDISKDVKDPVSPKKSAPMKHQKSTSPPVQKIASPVSNPNVIGTAKYKIDLSLITVETGITPPSRTPPGASAWDGLFDLLPAPGTSAKFPIECFETIESTVERKNKRAGRKQWRVTKIDRQNGRLFHL